LKRFFLILSKTEGFASFGALFQNKFKSFLLPGYSYYTKRFHAGILPRLKTISCSDCL
jgi:hypothetical protein